MSVTRVSELIILVPSTMNGRTLQQVRPTSARLPRARQSRLRQTLTEPQRSDARTCRSPQKAEVSLHPIPLMFAIRTNLAQSAVPHFSSALLLSPSFLSRPLLPSTQLPPRSLALSSSPRSQPETASFEVQKGDRDPPQRYLPTPIVVDLPEADPRRGRTQLLDDRAQADGPQGDQGEDQGWQDRERG